MKVGNERFTTQPMRLPAPSREQPAFSATLERGHREEALSQSTARQVQSILDDEAALDEAMARSLSGETFDQREMLALQATVYSYSQRVDVATRVIDRGASALKQLLNTQL